MSDFQDKNFSAVAARVNMSREIITEQQILKWAVQGKVFEAGFGLEDTAPNSQAAVDDTKATYALQAPAGVGLIVIPLLVRLSLTTEGGAGPTFNVMITKPASLCATALTLSGTASTSKHCVYRSNPAKTSAQATTLYGDPITVSALVAADYINAYAASFPDNLLSAGTAPTPAINVYDVNAVGPHLLTAGAALLVYEITGTSDSVWNCYMKWAEVTEDDLI